jgi:hypothetical protein
MAQSVGICVPPRGESFDGVWHSALLTILTGRNLPKIRQSREPEPSIVNEKTVADFTRVVEQAGFWSAIRWLTRRDRPKIDASPHRRLSRACNLR